MKVTSIRFGTVEVPDDKIICMEKPVLGFERYRRFCLLEIEEFRPLLWLQSVDDETVVLPVINPRIFYPDYKIEINPNEIAELRIADVSTVETYVVMTIADNPEEISVNLQGPILINTENNLGKQLVLVNSVYEVKHKIMPLLPVAQVAEPVGV